MPNLINTSPKRAQITYYLWKTLIKSNKRVFLILNYFGWSSLLLSAFAIFLDYRNGGTNYKGLLFAHWSPFRGLKCKLLLGKYCQLVFVYHYNFRLGAFKKFQIWCEEDIGCLNFWIFVTSKVAKFCKYQPHVDLNHLLPAVSTKIKKPKGVFQIEVF